MELIKDVKGSSKVLKTSLTPEDALYETRASENYTHQLIQMVHYAYYNHFPLSFSPDDIQLLITQGFCTHIKQNAEKFRKKFVEHQGQKELIVQVQDSDYNNYNWPQVIQQFSSLIKKNIGEERYNLCVHNYSTTTETIKTCYEISLMDTMQKYFKYTMMVGCGISKVKLLGTLEDWLKVRENLENLREFELDWWIDKIAPVLDQFINFYQRDVDKQFWSDIYKYQERKGFYSLEQENATGCDYLLFPLQDQ
ncbi:hypothetical protein FGO68_gene15011 [Halteria grandinella]|uniref:Uncharacterized protein n=1 Tax=Halteria grandinella TaxID=5974 RepID=A0A8J8NHT6_HALGN|nr:hypothetical protein FGO68_gene15011 [Halteria grandinella]